MSWWGGGENQRDARNGVACLGNHFIHFEARQLPTFARLGALGNLYLYFVRIHQIFCGDTETS